jgi:signal transduction histidine kinase
MARSADTLSASIDWEEATQVDELTSVEVPYELSAEVPSFPRRLSHGTRITLRNLKHDWTTGDFRDLAREVWMLRSPFRATRRGHPQDGFEIDFDAPEADEAREEFDDVLENVLGNWKARIRGRVEGGRRSGQANVQIDFLDGYPDHQAEETFSEIVALPFPNESHGRPLLDSVQFEIRIFRPEYRQADHVKVGDVRDYLEEYGGVNVYDAGFRLPHYGAKQDWLQVEYDHSHRRSRSQLLPEHFQIANMINDLPSNGRIFGAVEVDTGHERRIANRAPRPERIALTINVSRDRLVENGAYFQLRDLLRWSLDFYASRYRARKLRYATSIRDLLPAWQLQVRALQVLDESRGSMPAQVYEVVREEVSSALEKTRAEETYQREKAVLLAPLATAGMAALALAHEIHRETRGLKRHASGLRTLATGSDRAELLVAADAIDATSQRLEDLMRLFGPITNEEDRSGNDRLKVRVVLEDVARAMEPLTPRVHYDLSGVPEDLRFPEGSFAEWSALFQNLFSNAWNAMLGKERREIRCSGGRTRSEEYVKVSDTGSGLAVSLDESDRLFEPFERQEVVPAEKRSLMLGGQGLGLAIVRMIAADRSCDVGFVEAEPDFATTVALSWSPR